MWGPNVSPPQELGEGPFHSKPSRSMWVQPGLSWEAGPAMDLSQADNCPEAEPGKGRWPLGLELLSPHGWHLGPVAPLTQAAEA